MAVDWSGNLGEYEAVVDKEAGIQTTIATKGMRLLGHDSDWWNTVMLISLGCAALAAVGVGLATAAVIITQKREAIAAAQAFEQYKVGVAAQVAEANARAAEANKKVLEAQIELARFRAPRLPTAEEQALVTEKLKPFAGTEFDTGLAANSGEQADFLWRLEPAIMAAGWVHVHWVGPPWLGPTTVITQGPRPLSGSVAASNVEIHIHPGEESRLMPAAAALASALNEIGIAAAIVQFNTLNASPNAIHVLIGEKR